MSILREACERLGQAAHISTDWGMAGYAALFHAFDTDCLEARTVWNPPGWLK